MMDWYPIVKTIHVLLAIGAVGANATYGVWFARTRKTPEALPHVLRTLKFIDDAIANPCYALLLLTGILLVVLGNWRWTTPWLLSSLALFGVVAILGLGFYRPTLRRQIEALGRQGAESAAYRRLDGRNRLVGLLLALSVVALVALMVIKPA